MQVDADGTVHVEIIYNDEKLTYPIAEVLGIRSPKRYRDVTCSRLQSTSIPKRQTASIQVDPAAPTSTLSGRFTNSSFGG
jgi:hypothetical protein